MPRRQPIAACNHSTTRATCARALDLLLPMLPNQRTMNESKQLGAAIFGAGWVAGEHAKAYQTCPRTRLVAVGSRKLESATKCAEYAGARDAFVTSDFDALLARQEVDLVSIT